MFKRTIAIILALALTTQACATAPTSAAYRRTINPEVVQQLNKPIYKPWQPSTGEKIVFWTILVVGVAAFTGGLAYYRRTSTASNF